MMTVTETRMAKKAIGLHVDWQNNNFAHASCFLVHFFAVVALLHDCNMKLKTSDKICQ